MSHFLVLLPIAALAAWLGARIAASIEAGTLNLGFSTTLRNARADAITTAVGASGKLRIYNGSQPATGGTATTLLAELTCNATFAPSSSGGVLTLNAITSDSSADATGTATWCRFTTSGGTFVIDGTVSTSGANVNLNTTSVVTGAAVAISSATFTEGNV